MTKQSKKINHDFNIGDIVYVLNDYAIIPCIVMGISSTPIYKETVDIVDCIDKTSIIYTLRKIIRYRNLNNQIVCKVCTSEYDSYNYHSSKVYYSVDDLLSDLEKTTEIS